MGANSGKLREAAGQGGVFELKSMAGTFIITKKIGKSVERNPLVSVIVPAYNVADFISETLDSVFAQTFKNYEVVVVNDGSPDTEQLEKVLEKYYDRLVYLKQENGGASRARNTGIKASRGELLAFLDGDDIWLPEYLAEQTEFLRATDSDMVYADALLFGSVSRRKDHFMRKSPSRGIFKTESLIEGSCNVITSGTIARREKVLSAGMFDEELPRIGMEDFDLWVRLARSGARINYRRKQLLKYRVRLDSLSGSNVKRARRSLTALETLERKYQLSDAEKKAVSNRRLSAVAEFELESGKYELTLENYEKAREHFISANRYYRKSKLDVVVKLLEIKPRLVRKMFEKFRRTEFLFAAPVDFLSAESQNKLDSNVAENPKANLPESLQPELSLGETVTEIVGERSRSNLSLTNQSAWLLFGKVVGFVLSFLLPLLTVRYLAQAQVGVYRLSFLVVTNAVTILPLGFSMSAFYFLNRDPARRPQAVFNILLFNFVMGGLACLTLFAFPQLLGNLFKSEELTRLAPYIGVVVWLWIFSAFLELAALANQETKLATAFIILAQFTKMILMVGAVLIFTTVEAFLDAAMIQGAIQTVVLLVYLNLRFPRFWKSFDWTFFREHLRYAVPFGLAGLLYTLQTDVHNYFVGYKFSEAEYAIYSTGCFELPLIGMLYESISGVMIPRMSELESAGKTREMLLTSVRAMNKLALVYFPMFAFLIINSEEFITTLFTKSYAASIPIFQINLLILPLYCLILDPIGRAFSAVGKFLLKVRIVLFALLLVALWFGIRHFDLRGMIGIVVVMVVVERAVTIWKILKLLDIRRGDSALLKNIFKTALAASVAGLFLVVIHWLDKDFLMQYCQAFSSSLFNLLNIGKIAEFAGGMMFLGINFVLFLAIYLFFITRFGAMETDDIVKIKEIFNRRLANFRAMFRLAPKAEI